MGYDPNECNRQLKAKNLLPCGAGAQDPHCIDFNNSPAHAALCPDPSSPTIYTPISSSECFSSVLNKVLPYRGLKFIIPDCVAKATAEPQNDWEVISCWCCCSCFAYGTPINTPAGLRAIETFTVGDQVLVAKSMRTAGGNTKLDWQPAQVQFSAGTGPDVPQASMIHLHFGQGQTLIATPDQPIVVEGGLLVQVGRLIPGKDRLLLADGTAVDLYEARLGSFNKGVHHIATELSFDRKVDGHLIDASGAVCGDYLLQVHLSELPASALVPNQWDRPMIGSDEYRDAHPSVVSSPFHALATNFAAETTAMLMTEGFRPYVGAQRTIPDNAAAYFTDAQESDIISNPLALKLPLRDTMVYGLAGQLIRVLNAFYDDVIFYIAWDDIHINSYAFLEYGRKIVYIAGGLLRVQALGIEGLGVILCQQTAAFEATQKPVPPLANKGLADYWGMLAVSRKIYLPNVWFSQVFAGTKQLATIFGFVSPENAAGSGDDGTDPSLACRTETQQAALSAAPLPPCAGGAKPTPLRVQDVTVADGTVTVTFNVAASLASAQNPADYLLAPKATITTATLNPRGGSSVALVATLAPSTDYTLTVSGLTTVEGEPLDPAHASGRFSTPVASAGR